LAWTPDRLRTKSAKSC